jgi:hypothetical protein
MRPTLNAWDARAIEKGVQDREGVNGGIGRVHDRDRARSSYAQGQWPKFFFLVRAK